jgi:hypothetical protein
MDDGGWWLSGTTDSRGEARPLRESPWIEYT